MRSVYKPKSSLVTALVLALAGSAAAYAQGSEQGKQPLQLTDIMQFREIEQRVVSENGQWMAYAAVPDFGDSEGHVVNTLTSERFSLERADQPAISPDGRYVAFRQRAPLLTREQAKHSDASDELKTAAKSLSVVLLDTQSGSQELIESVKAFSFTGDGKTLLLLAQKGSDDDSKVDDLRLRNLENGSERTVSNVKAFSNAQKGPRVAVVLETDSANGSEGSDKKTNSIRVINTANGSALTLAESQQDSFKGLAFNPEGTALAYMQGPVKSDNPDPAQQLWLWQYGNQQSEQIDTSRENFILSEHQSPRWSDDGERIFIGYRPEQADKQAARNMPETAHDLYDLERLRDDRKLQVWHGNDGRIVTHQRENYRNYNQASTPAVVWVDGARVVVLGNDIEDSYRLTQHANAQLISNGSDYLREITWNGFYHDIDHVDLNTGKRQNVVSKVRSGERGSLSPSGRYVAYVEDENYYVFDAEQGTATQVAVDVNVSWVDEQNDRPMEAGSYGVAGWLEDESAFFAYDRFDIWSIQIDGEAVKLTNGREEEKQFRVQTLTDELAFSNDAKLLVHSYSDPEKYHGFWSLDLARGDFSVIHEGQKRYQFVDYLEETERLLFTEEDFRQFPDIWSAQLDLTDRVQLTQVNPQIEQFKWGNAELIDWQTEDGDSLQGVVIKPDDYDASRTYPVMVYYYEKFSQRLYHFNQMKVNHRPNFPFYVGQDYVVFLPDIRFRPGAPGPSATESLVPGINKLIEMEIADPDAIGLHGHSWSGYQSAFVVVETDMFAAVVTGAPVANMTSAYTGIRWQSGLARQFQYETGQSRIGPSMYEDLDPYIKNSPVFFADQINTPMLIQFGDADGAVPWEQGIEYYMALRRLDKDVAMLHYEGEPHHLQQYPNKVDYSIKMLEFFDHYLKGAPAPDWWEQGMPFQKYN